MNMFFHSSALTVGMMKKGEISITRTTPRPGKLRSTNTARLSPTETVMISMDPTSSSVFRTAGRKAGSVRKNS